jgi:hypothetical protein
MSFQVEKIFSVVKKQVVLFKNLSRLIILININLTLNFMNI